MAALPYLIITFMGYESSSRNFLASTQRFVCLMKYALSTAVISIMLLGLTAPASATTDTNDATLDEAIAPVTVTQIAETGITTEYRRTTQENSEPITSVSSREVVPTNTLTTLVDPITHKTIDNSYPIEVSSFLSLEQAQNILLQVSPKLAANQAAIAASEYQTDALKTIDNPLVFARVSASAYTVQENIDLSSLKNGIRTLRGMSMIFCS